MKKQRLERLNSLLREVIAEVIQMEVRNPKIAHFTTVTRVEISPDLHHGKVFISVIGTPAEKQATIEALESAASFIALHSSKKMVIRYFPALTFFLDDSVEKYAKIEQILQTIQEEQSSRKQNSSDE